MPTQTSKRIRERKDGPDQPPPPQHRPEDEANDVPGRSGQGADSALAHLIEQQQAREHKPDLG